MTASSIATLSRQKATAAGLLSYFCWGFFPIYWKFLRSISATEILAHRMIWACLFYLGIYAWTSMRLKSFGAILRQRPAQWLAAAMAALVLAVNWGFYIYAVNSGQIVQGSLAYFINPLLNVAVGVLFFRESLPMLLRLALVFALAGVLVQAAFAPSFPWIALILAVSFCSYGVIKKTRSIPPDVSSAMEGLAGLVPALILAFFCRQQSSYELTARDWALLIGSGAVTGLPLFLFSMASQVLPYSLMGMMQFIAPTLQLLVGLVLYDEQLGWSGLLSFALIWTGVALYSWQLVRVGQRKRALASL